MKYPLRFVVSYVQPVTQQYESRAVQNLNCNPRIPKERVGAARPSYINYRLKSEVSITLRCWLCSTRYTAVRIKNCFKNASAVEVATMKNTDDFHYEGKPSVTLWVVSSADSCSLCMWDFLFSGACFILSQGWLTFYPTQ